MNTRVLRSPAILASALLFAAVVPCVAQGPKAHVIPLKPAGTEITPLLSGPPQTVTMKSGLVVLAPGESVGKHSTQGNEEILIVLEGQGEMAFADGSKLPVKANSAVYCPHGTEHNVTNTGTNRLRYVYVVARAK